MSMSYLCYVYEVIMSIITALKMKFSIEEIRSFMQIWSHLLKKSLMENFIFCAVNAIIKESAFDFFQENDLILTRHPIKCK